MLNDNEQSVEKDIFVFNEKFIDSQIKFKESDGGLSTIIKVEDEVYGPELEIKRSFLEKEFEELSFQLEGLKTKLEIEEENLKDVSELVDPLFKLSNDKLAVLVNTQTASLEAKNLINFINLYNNKYENGIDCSKWNAKFEREKKKKSGNFIEQIIAYIISLFTTSPATELRSKISHYKNSYLLEIKKYQDGIKIINEKIETNIHEKESTIENIKNLGNSDYGKNLSADDINNHLKYIFFHENRLKIEYSDNVYKVKSNGSDIPPSGLSMGERNIIALSYFISTLNLKLNRNMEFSRNCLIIFDDPISSLDQNNNIGLYSYFRSIFSSILNNSDSNIIVLTHRLEVAYHFEELFKDISKKNYSL